MDFQSWFGMSRTWQTGVILLAVLAALVAGMSGLIYPSQYSPLFVGVGVAAAVTIVAWLRKPVGAVYAALFVVLLPIGLIPPEIHSNLNRSLTIIALVVWLFDAIARRRRVTWTYTTLLMVGFLVWASVTLAWAAYPSVATSALQTYALRLILFLVLIVNEIRSKADLDGLMRILAFNGWILVLVGAIKVMSMGFTPGTRFQVAGMNENGIGILALVAMPGVLWQAMQASGWRKTASRLLSFTFVVLALVLTMLSGSRGSAISLLVSLLAFWLWKPTRPWGILGLLILTLTVAIAPFVFSTIAERFAVEEGDTLFGGREGLWQAAWLIIRDHVLNGVGIGNAPYEVISFVRLFRSIGQYDWAAIHNPVLTIWAESGLPGLMFYLGVLGSAVWEFVRQYRHDKKAAVQWLLPYYALISSVFLGYMISWIKGGGMESDFTYFLMLALLLVPSGLEVKGPESNARISPQGARGKSPGVLSG
jgi:O-antigen ligase